MYVLSIGFGDLLEGSWTGVYVRFLFNFFLVSFGFLFFIFYISFFFFFMNSQFAKNVQIFLKIEIKKMFVFFQNVWNFNYLVQTLPRNLQILFIKMLKNFIFCSCFQKHFAFFRMFEISNFVHFFQKVVKTFNWCSQFQNLFAFLEKCLEFQKFVHVFQNSLLL